MAKEVQLGKKPADKEALLARATGAGKKLPPPPPAARPRKLPPGVTGTPPMPTERVVGNFAPSSLTPLERETLEAVGWSDDMPLPSNSAEILQEFERRQAEVPPLPLDPRTPKLDVQTVPIEEVSAADRARLLDAAGEGQNVLGALYQGALKEHAENRAAAAGQAPKNPGVKEALAAAAQAASYRPRHDEEAIVDDRPRAEPRAEPPGVPPPGDPGPQRSDTGADARPAVCLHCGHDPSVPSIEEPPYEEKLAFLHAVLGQKCYPKRYDLFGGNVTVTFRTLTTREIEAVFRQAYLDDRAGKLPTKADYWEAVNRYRLYLQLTSLSAPGPDGFVHELPDGLSEETNPDATACWKPVEPLEPGQTALPMIEDFVIGNVLKTELLFRTVHVACNEFNRLVAKLEAMADNSDFWKPTGEPS
jgi:hypothetical protein